MAVKFSNNAATLLAANATTSDTTLTVSDGSVFPTLSGSDHTYVTLEDVNANREIVKVTARSGNNLTVVRAQDGTTARAFSAADKCELRVIAALLNDLNTDADTESVSKSGDTMTGGLIAPSLDISGNIDVDGTTNLDVVDIDGAVDMASTLAVGGVVTASASVVANDEFRGAVVLYSANENSPYLIAGTSGYTGATTSWNTYGVQHRLKTNAGGTPRITIDNNTGEQWSLNASGGMVLTPSGSDGHAIFNEGGIDADFRVESNNNANMLFVDGGNNAVGIGTSTNSGFTLNVAGATQVQNNLVVVSTGGANLTQGDIMIKSSTADSPSARGQGVFMFNEGADQTWYAGTGYNAGAHYHIGFAASASASKEGARVTNGVFHLYNTTTGAVFNENGLDRDFRVESDTKTHAFFVEGAGAAANQLRIGMGTGTITNPYAQTNFTDLNIDGVWGGVISFKLGGTEKGWIGQRNSGNGGMALGSSSGNSLYLNSGGNTSRMEFTSAGDVVVNPTGADNDFRVQSDALTHALFVDGGTNHVGMGTATLNRSGLGADHICLTVGADNQMGMLELQGTRTSNADLGRVSFLNAGTRRAEIVAARIDADNSTKLYFQTSNAGSLGTRLTIGKDGAATFSSTVTSTGLTANVPTGNGLVINSADIATIKMKSTGGGVKNWGFATTNLAAGDFGIYESNSNGGDPITAGAAKLYFNAAGAATFSSDVHADSFSLNDDKYMFFGTSDDARIRFDGTDSLYITCNNGTADKLKTNANTTMMMQANGNQLLTLVANSEVVVNNDSNDIDFRVESDNLTHALFVEGGTGQLRVNTANWPSNTFGDAAGRHIVGGSNEPLFVLWNEASVAANNISTLAIGAKSATATTAFGGGWIRGGLENNSDSDGFLGFYTTKDAGANAEQLRISSSGAATFSGDVTLAAGKSLTLTSGMLEMPTNYKVRWGGRNNYSVFSDDANYVIVKAADQEAVRFGNTESVFNNGGDNRDFRVESDSNANAFWVDASANQVRTDAVFVHDADGSNQPFYITRSGGLDQGLKVTVDDNNVMLTSVQDEASGANFIFYSTNATASNVNLAQFDYSSGTVFNEGGVASQNFRVESDTNTHAFYLNAANGYIGMGAGASPIQPLTIGASSGANLNYYSGTSNVISSGSGIKVSKAIANDAGAGSGLNLSNTSSTDGTMSPMLHFSALSASTTYSTTYAGIWGRKRSSGTDTNWNAGSIEFGTAHSAGIHKRMEINYLGSLITTPQAGASVIFNENGVDADFRVESDVNANSILVNGETGGISFGTTVTNMASNHNNVAGLGIANNGKVEMATTSNVTALEVSKNEGTDGSVLYLRKQSTGFATHNVSSGNYLFGNPTSDKDVIITGNDGGVAINALTLDMSEAGAATFASDVLPATNGTQDLGSTSLRWANVYTGDLHLSNEEKGGNDVDGTTGNWTIQEGAENLYIKNNKTGKQYKFALEEIV